MSEKNERNAYDVSIDATRLSMGKLSCSISDVSKAAHLKHIFSLLSGRN
jgi:hypothetical protein